MDKNVDPTERLGLELRKRRWTLTIAESCTGGLICDTITDRPGSSDYFLGGVIAYSDRVKVDLLAVPDSLITAKGAVSPEVAVAMARGVKVKLSSDVSAGVTGIAGPAGGSPEKAVGLVYISAVTSDEETVREFHFRGGRKEIKKQASEKVLELILSLL
jgi:PncC family amidohydrolase